SRGKAHADYTKFLDPAGLKGARIGVARGFFGTNDHVDRIIEEALAAMRAAGAVVVDPVEVRHVDKLGASEVEVLLYEYKSDLDAYLREAGAGAAVRSIAELIEFNARNAAREMPYFGQEHLVE